MPDENGNPTPEELERQKVAGPLPRPIDSQPLGAVPLAPKGPEYEQQADNPESPSLRPQRFPAPIQVPDAEAQSNRLGADLADKQNSQAGVETIKNPILRVLARVGDIAGTALFPTITAQIPGTELHHRVQIAELQHQYNEALAGQREQAGTANLQAEADSRNAPPPPPSPEVQAYNYELSHGKNPTEALGVTKEAGKAEHAASPEQAAFDYYTKEKGMNPAEANAQLAKDKAAGRPPTEKIAEEIREQIADAYDKGDPKTVKQLQSKLQALDPNAQQRMQITIQNHADANERAKDNLSRSDIRTHDKAYVQPAEAVEKSYQMMNDAYSEYKAAKAQGKELPTGAQSMLALSTHLATTFGNVKGSRVTRDMIQEHLGARGISDSALTAVQRLTNGDVLSPDQWDAFHKMIADSRRLSWQTATKEADRKHIPVDFLPPDLQQQGALNESGGATHFVEGGNHWDIPADKIEAFKKSHPNAQAQ